MPGGGLEFACEKPKERNPEDPEHVLKALQSLETTEEKLAALSKKYSELLDEHKGVQTSFKQSQRTLAVLSREKDQLQSEHSKAVLAKSKLEALCRELQRHNKLVKDESIARVKEDEERRKEVTAKFQVTINDIQQQMNEHYEKNTALREENLELANKLKGLIEQYELREQQIDKVFKSKDIESQLYDARLQQAALQISEEKEKHLQDKQLLMREALESQKKILLMEEQEKALRSQVAMYSEKYDDFQSTLTRSNDVFANFKTEMDKMSKKIKSLEKETASWRQKWEASQKSLLTMAEQKARSDKEATVMQTKLSKLESLCRALQEERRQRGGGASSGAGASTEGGASSGGGAVVEEEVNSQGAAHDSADKSQPSDSSTVAHPASSTERLPSPAGDQSSIVVALGVGIQETDQNGVDAASVPSKALASDEASAAESTPARGPPAVLATEEHVPAATVVEEVSSVPAVE